MGEFSPINVNSTSVLRAFFSHQYKHSSPNRRMWVRLLKCVNKNAVISNQFSGPPLFLLQLNLRLFVLWENVGVLDHCCRWARSYRDVRFTAIPGRPWILLRHKSTKLHTFCYDLMTNPKISQGKCVQNITGNVSIGLVYFTIAESLFYPEKLSHSGFSGAMILLVLTVDAS